MNVDLNKLSLFAAVYEAGSVTRAAEALHITPSAVSQSLGNLEADLGFKLFQRISKKLVPMAEAEALYEVFRRTSKEIATVVEASRSQKKTLTGTLKIGAPQEFGARHVVPAVKEFPEAQFRLEFGLPDDLMVKVISQELDFAFCDDGPYLRKYDKLLVHQTVFKEEAILICSKHFYHDEVKGQHSFAHLSALPHVDYRADRKVIHLWYEHHFHKTPARIDLRLSAPTVSAMKEAALSGIGLAFIPTYLIEAELKSGKLVEIPTRKAPYINPIVLVQKADKVPGHLEKTFIGKFIGRTWPGTL